MRFYKGDDGNWLIGDYLAIPEKECSLKTRTEEGIVKVSVILLETNEAIINNYPVSEIEKSATAGDYYADLAEFKAGVFDFFTATALASSVQIQTLDQAGESADVSQGFGIGVRQHDDVMLAFGYSRKASKIINIPSDNFAIITLTIPAGVTHHAEQRYLESYNGIAQVKVVVGLVEGDLPAIDSQIPAFNQKGATLDPAVLSIFNYRGMFDTNPISAALITDETTIDQLHLHASTGNARTASETTASNVKGRHYEEGIYTVIVENVSNATLEFTYAYDWHEY